MFTALKHFDMSSVSAKSWHWMKHEDSATIYEISQSEHGVNVEKEIVVSADLSVKLFLHQKNYSRLEASSMRGSY